MTIERNGTVTLGTDGEFASASLIVDGVAPNAQASSDGYPVYQVGSEATTAVLPQAEGAVQLLNVIEGPSSPTSFAYELALAPDLVATLDEETGMAAFLDEEGVMHGGVAPAWAVDAAGVEVPSRFEFDGTNLTQVIEHDEQYTYPIVADPYMGRNIFAFVNVSTTDRRGPIANMRLSPWGVSLYLTGGTKPWYLPANGLVNFTRGQQILNTYGWAEMRARIGYAYRDYYSRFGTTSIQQQFSCHAFGWPGDVKGAWVWNLESWRPAMTSHWSRNVVNHRCNWNYSDGRV